MLGHFQSAIHLDAEVAHGAIIAVMVLGSERAVEVSVHVMRALVPLREAMHLFLLACERPTERVRTAQFCFANLFTPDLAQQTQKVAAHDFFDTRTAVATLLQ